MIKQTTKQNRKEKLRLYSQGPEVSCAVWRTSALLLAQNEAVSLGLEATEVLVDFETTSHFLVSPRKVNISSVNIICDSLELKIECEKVGIHDFVE